MNSLVVGISNAINGAFSNANIYFQKVTQDLKLPAFFIEVPGLNPGKRINGIRTTQYQVQIVYYHSDIIDYKEELLNTASTLSDVLDVIIVDSKPIRGNNLKVAVSGEILRAYVEYKITTAPMPSKDNMETVDISAEVIE